jgi:hypothetical protein
MAILAIVITVPAHVCQSLSLLSYMMYLHAIVSTKPTPYTTRRVMAGNKDTHSLSRFLKEDVHEG